jgi:2-dehydro-3-deoxyphosphogluconate aldolase/(4S)-4-hydroxy-2-oxoglutarate aldolase
MSQRNEVTSQIGEQKLVAVIRSKAEQVLSIAAALVEGGVRAMEITFTVPRAPEMIAETLRHFGGQILLGAGTVLTPEQAEAAIAAGARFVVAPNTNFDVIRFCNQRDVAVMPGALSPTEVAAAWQGGADVVKLFPAETVGIAYLKALRAPMPDIPLMPTGGVDVGNAADWLRAGAFALGVGSQLVSKDALTVGRYDEITSLARLFVAAIAKAKE